jgi:hypothetical protein
MENIHLKPSSLLEIEVSYLRGIQVQGTFWKPHN